MRLIAALIPPLILLASPLRADPSTFADSAAKIRAMLDAPEIAAALHQAPMAKIEETGTAPDGAGLWQIMVQECDLVVRITPGASPGTYQAAPDGPCK